jgi:hypothetical protein
MEIKEIQTKKQEVVVDIICDSCGQSCKKYQSNVDNPVRTDHGEPYYSFEYMELKATWGYHSDYDTEQWTAQVCQKCVDGKLSFIKFKKRELL